MPLPGSAARAAERPAQAAMRYSDSNLTMNTYTDPKLIDVRKAVERLPALTSSGTSAKSAPVSKLFGPAPLGQLKSHTSWVR
jgi:hypothetical protein